MRNGGNSIIHFIYFQTEILFLRLNVVHLPFNCSYIFQDMVHIWLKGVTFQDLGKDLGKGLGKGLDKEKILANQIH